MMEAASCCGDVFHWAGTESLVRIETGANVHLPTGLESDRTALKIPENSCAATLPIQPDRV